MGFGTVTIGYVGFVIWMEAVRVFVIKNSQDTIFDLNPFAREGNDALDDILIFDASSGLTGESATVSAVCENYDFSALRGIFFAFEVRYGDSETIYYDAVIRHESIFHAGADDVVATEDKAI